MINNLKFKNQNSKLRKVISPNLLPQEFKEGLYVQAVGDTARKIGQIGIVLLLCFVTIGFLYLYHLNNSGSFLEEKFNDENDLNKLKELNKIKKDNKDLNILVNKIEQSLDKKYDWSKVLGELPKITPEGVVLTNWTPVMEEPGWVSIKGIAKTRDAFLTLKENLEKTEFCENLESPLSNYANPEMAEFEIKIKLRGWKPIFQPVQTKPTVNAEEEEQ